MIPLCGVHSRPPEIAHAGYVLIGILSMNAAGYMSAIFYVTALLIIKFTVFLVVVKVADDGSFQFEESVCPE